MKIYGCRSYCCWYAFYMIILLTLFFFFCYWVGFRIFFSVLWFCRGEQMCNVITNVTLDYWYTVIMWIRWRGLSDSLITTLSHGLSMCTSMLSVCMPTNLPFYSVDLCMGSLFCTINDVSTQFFWILQQYRCLYKKKKKKT